MRNVCAEINIKKLFVGNLLCRIRVKSCRSNYAHHTIGEKGKKEGREGRLGMRHSGNRKRVGGERKQELFGSKNVSKPLWTCFRMCFKRNVQTLHSKRKKISSKEATLKTITEKCSMTSMNEGGKSIGRKSVSLGKCSASPRIYFSGSSLVAWGKRAQVKNGLFLASHCNARFPKLSSSKIIFSHGEDNAHAFPILFIIPRSKKSDAERLSRESNAFFIGGGGREEDPERIVQMEGKWIE